MSDMDIKLFVSTHTGGVAFPSCRQVVPVQVGAALAPERLAGMAHDDDGEGISEKNRRYCELTAQYWAWKNVDADYYGFMHYRRYLVFDEGAHYDTNYFADVALTANDAATCARLGYDEATINSVVGRYDLILPEPGSFVGGETIYEAYAGAREHHIEDLDCVLEIIRERHPEFLEAAQEYLNGTEGYFCNMFVMRRELFCAYSEWLFDILFEHERRRDVSAYDRNSYRVSGYLGERLLGVYATWLKRQGVRWTTLQRTLFDEVGAVQTLEPAFPPAPGEPEPACVVLSANEYYAPYLSALLESLRAHRSPERRYDVIVLSEDITDATFRLMREQVADERLSLRLLDVRPAMRDYQSRLFLRGHFRVETYFRLLLPQLLPKHHKIVYLDSDLIVLHDVAELYDTELGDDLVGAVRDADTAGLYNGAQLDKRAYMDDVLGIERPYDYFQAGVIVFNLDAWRATYTPDEIFALAQQRDWQLLDQDVLNRLCQGRVTFLDMTWNVVMDMGGIRIERIISWAPRDLYDAYMASREHPYVVHYAGPEKPWSVPGCDMAQHFWRYARRSPFYEEALRRMAADIGRDDRSALTKAKDFAVHRVGDPIAARLLKKDSKPYERVKHVYGKLLGPRNLQY